MPDTHKTEETVSSGTCRFCGKSIALDGAGLLYVHRARFFFAMVRTARGNSQISVDVEPDGEALLGASFCIQCALEKHIEGLDRNAVRAILSQIQGDKKPAVN